MIQKVAHKLDNNLRDDVTRPSMNSITALAIQLNKLKILDTKLRVDSIDFAIKQGQKKVGNLRSHNKQIETQVDSLRLKLLKKESELIKDHSQRSDQLTKEIDDFQKPKLHKSNDKQKNSVSTL